MPHVVHVVRTLGRGGMEKNLRRVALALEPRGVRHSILLLSDRRDLLPFPRSIPVRRIVSAPRDPRLIAYLARQLFLLRPTVIHARNWATWPDTALARMLGCPRTPLIFSYHGMDGSVVSRADRMKFRAVEKFAHRIFAVSRSARDLLVDAYGLSRARVGVIANGVDAEHFSPEPAEARPPENTRVVIGAAGRFFPVKNFPMLLRAIARLVADGLDVELRLAGEGPNAAELRALGAELGLGDRLVFSGYVEDLAPFLRTLDVFALASDNEANPNALLEAMATGRACVATDVGGSVEVLERGRLGLLVPPGDDRAMASALGELVRHPDLRDRLGEAARWAVVSRHAQGAMFDAYERLYRDPLHAPLD